MASCFVLNSYIVKGFECHDRPMHSSFAAATFADFYNIKVIPESVK